MMSTLNESRMCLFAFPTGIFLPHHKKIIILKKLENFHFRSPKELVQTRPRQEKFKAKKFQKCKI